ncbi:Thymidine phosphorylase [hydrothermal vent metagenome]|uniref:Thymidine phosphorylase n=1 Tax=hydrothermal vent metagenome TaxID=652676 RepID=A0A3B0YWN7_9ZZZZ
MSDTNKRNVVNLGDYDQMRRGLGNGPGTQALREIRDHAYSKLELHLGQMMEQVDDTLFSRAEKAENNTVQTQYFDAMRELRIIRKNIESDFLQEFSDRFNQGVPRETAATAAFSLNFEDDPSIGLVGKNELEEELAINNMVNKTRNTCSQSLFALDKRIGFLIHDPDLERWYNPLGPETLCDVFKEAVQRVETGLEIRLLIFKLFDQHVINHMDDVYKQINQHLIKLGVMPEIKTSVRKSNPTPARPQVPTSGMDVSEGYQAAPVAGASADSYATPQTGAHSQPAGAFSGGGVQASINALTFLQQGGAVTDADDSDGYAPDPSAIASGQANILHGIRQSPILKQLGKAGDSTIDIIAMMFDYILDDKSVPDAMRALIGRLQIPVLKVALLDKTFFSHKSHPARQLLNRLAATAVEWNQGNSDADLLYQKMATVIQTVLDDFEEDIGLFETVLNDFDEFLFQEDKRAELRAERSAKIMEEQEKLDVAKSTTMEEITPRINAQQGTEFVREFVTHQWRNLLFITCARQGKDSDAWRQAVATMDDLIWSVKPKHTLDDRKRLVAMQPILLGNLRAGMERLSIPATQRDDFIAQLIHAHGRTAINHEQEDLEEQAQVENSVTELPQSTIAQPPADSVETTSATATEADTSTPEADTAARPSPVDDDATALVQQLTTGTWMEFRGADGQPLRAKLSWVSPITNTYLFTNHAGLKAGNYSLEELVQLVRGARAKVVDDKKTPLMDRAVSSVLSEYNRKN